MAFQFIYQLLQSWPIGHVPHTAQPVFQEVKAILVAQPAKFLSRPTEHIGDIGIPRRDDAPGGRERSLEEEQGVQVPYIVEYHQQATRSRLLEPGSYLPWLQRSGKLVFLAVKSIGSEILQDRLSFLLWGRLDILLGRLDILLWTNSTQRNGQNAAGKVRLDFDCQLRRQIGFPDAGHTMKHSRGRDSGDGYFIAC